MNLLFFALLVLLSVQEIICFNGSEFIERSLKCPRRSRGPRDRVIGGEDAPSLTWYPSVVHLEDIGCGATIIKEGWLLTAAHCPLFKDAIVMAGNPFKCTNHRYEQIRKIQNHYRHEDYEGRPKFINDIALFTVDKPFKWTPAVQPVKLVTADFRYPDEALATVVGWGQTVPGDKRSQPKHLQSVDVPSISYQQCYKTIAKYGQEYHPGRDCYGFKEGGKDACQGDSGSPLYGTATGKPPSASHWEDHILLGLVSYGYNCALPGVPGIYTGVQYYLKWINGTMQRNPYISSSARKDFRGVEITWTLTISTILLLFFSID